MTKYAKHVVLIIIFSTVTISCTSENEQAVIGAILAETGESDFIGEPEAKVIDQMIRMRRETDMNVPPIKIESYDSEGKLTSATNAFSSLVGNNNVIAIIGPSTSGESIPLAKRAFEKKIPLLSLAASREIVHPAPDSTNPWAFKFAQNDDLAARRLIAAMEQQNERRVAFIYQNSGFGKSGRSVFGDEVTETPISISYETSFPSGLSVPETYASAVPSNVDAIVIWGTSPVPRLVQSINSNSRLENKQIYLSHGNATLDFIKSAGSAAEGTIVVGSRVLLPSRFLDESNRRDRVVMKYRKFWEANFSGPPSHFGGHARDALDALLTIITSQNVIAKDISKTRHNIRNELEKLGPFYGVTGVFQFNPNDHAGLDTSAFETYRIQNGEFIPYSESK
jgi:branched-chain amino acid transport system substrate-binding protein